MSINDTDVLARLRAGADTVEEHRFDAHEVLAGSRRALRRRRSWQAVGACTTAVVAAFSVALVGPVPVPGVGDVTLPGSEQVRELFGLADASGCVAPEPAMTQSPVEPGTSLRPGVTIDLARARPMSSCFDVRPDGHFTLAGIDPSTLTEDGTFWSAPEGRGGGGYFYRIDPFDGPGDRMMAPVSGAKDDAEHMIGGLTPQGDEAAWFEITTESTDRPPGRVVLAAGSERSDSVSGEHYTSRSIAEIHGDYVGFLAVTGQRVAWRQEGVVPGGSTDTGSTTDPWGLPAWVSSLDSGEPHVLAENATAIGGDGDEIVVATLDQPDDDVWTTTFTSFGDDGSETSVLTLEHPGGTYVPLVDITDDVLTYALDGGYHLAVVPRVDGVADGDAARAVAVRLGNSGVDSLSAAGDAVVWVSGSVAYLLRGDAADGGTRPDLVRIGQAGLGEQLRVGIAGDRIAWSTVDDAATGQTEGTGITVNVGTLPGFRTDD